MEVKSVSTVLSMINNNKLLFANPLSNINCFDFSSSIFSMAGLMCGSQVAGRRSQVADHCFTNTESILNIL